MMSVKVAAQWMTFTCLMVLQTAAGRRWWERWDSADLGAISGIPTADDTQHGSLGGPCSGAFLTSRSS
jgi:hypothetical protein